LIDHLHCIDLPAGRLRGLTSADDLDALFAHLAGHPNRATLALYFHGGLNSRAEGMARCAEMLPWFLAQGAYPVFFAWESAYGEVIGNQLKTMLGEPLFRALHARGLDFAREKIRGASIRGPAADAALRESMLAGIDGGTPDEAALDPDERRRVFTLKRREAAGFETMLLNDPELRHHLAASPSGNWLDPSLQPPADGRAQTRAEPFTVLAALAAAALVRVFARLAGGRDHGMRATLFEEFAHALAVGGLLTGPFALMKAQIDQAFDPEVALSGGSAFIERLRQAHDSGYRPRLLLIGHSAGAIYICRFIDAARRWLPASSFDVVFMTPGVSFDRFAATLDAGAASIRNFRSYSLDESAEEADPLSPNPLVETFYPRSTLYFASGVLEYDAASGDAGDRPLLGMQRYFNRSALYTAPAIARVRDYLAERPDRLVWIARDGEFGPVGHSGIENNPAMRRHLGRIVAAGFDA